MEYNADLRNVIGKCVRTARLGNNYTQQQLSDKLETFAVYIDRAGISKIEQRKRIVTDYELFVLCKILNMDINKLFENFHLNFLTKDNFDCYLKNWI